MAIHEGFPHQFPISQACMAADLAVVFSGEWVHVSCPRCRNRLEARSAPGAVTIFDAEDQAVKKVRNA